MVDNFFNVNYFENEYYKIKIYNNLFEDKFKINIKNDKIYIERIDIKTGWGQDLNLLFFDKTENKESIINVGYSDFNKKKIKFLVNQHQITNHFENNKFKIYYISEKFNDIFNVQYDENNGIIKVQRIDSNDGWGQNLNLLYEEKNTLKRKVINIGKSFHNSISKKININEILYINVYNYYESKKYEINIFDNHFNDIFYIDFFEESNTIFVKRMDKKKGWGQNLKCMVVDKSNKNEFIIYNNI